MVFRINLAHREFAEILDTNYIAALCTGYTLPTGVYEISDIKSMIESLIPDDIIVDITIDDVRLRSNLTSNKILRFTKTFFNSRLGFI